MPLEVALGFYSIENSLLSDSNKSFRIPFIKDADEGFGYASNVYKNENSSLSLAYYNTGNNEIYDKQALVSSYNFGSKDSKKSIVLGYSLEEERFLGSNSNGAFNLINQENPTNFIAKKFNAQFLNGDEFLITASFGLTDVNTNKDTLINDIGTLSSSSFALKYTTEKMITNKDSF